jgi:hypothetical protein
MDKCQERAKVRPNKQPIIVSSSRTWISKFLKFDSNNLNSFLNLWFSCQNLLLVVWSITYGRVSQLPVKKHQLMTKTPPFFFKRINMTLVIFSSSSSFQNRDSRSKGIQLGSNVALLLSSDPAFRVPVLTCVSPCVGMGGGVIFGP